MIKFKERIKKEFSKTNIIIELIILPLSFLGAICTIFITHKIGSSLFFQGFYGGAIYIIIGNEFRKYYRYKMSNAKKNNQKTDKPKRYFIIFYKLNYANEQFDGNIPIETGGCFVNRKKVRQIIIDRLGCDDALVTSFK